MKKIISFLLAAAVAVTSAAALAGCAGTEYPVEIANIQINKEPSIRSLKISLFLTRTPPISSLIWAMTAKSWAEAIR